MPRFSTLLFMTMLFLVPGFCADRAAGGDGEGLFPPINPFRSGTLKFSDLHDVYYECCGNPKGKPVLVLHGGPGAGCYPRLRQYFNPEKYLIVLHDQRGAGRSAPHGEIRENTTWDLVLDIERLRKHLKLGKVLVFGGSWGTTLGVAYAETYPDNVSAMILRGVFTGTAAEVEFHYRGAARFFPEEHAALIAALPDPARGADPAYLLELANHKDAVLRMKVLDALAIYEFKLSTLNNPIESIHEMLKGFPDDVHRRLATLDLFYSSNLYFLEEGQLLRDAPKLKKIPAILIHGRYDMATQPGSAYRLHKAMPLSRLVIVEEAGHSESEEAITAEILKATAAFE